MVAKCQCGECKKYFVGPTAHEAHRTGNMKKGEKRRCLTTQEMHDAGFGVEEKQVKYRLDNKPASSEQDVWFLIKAREHLISIHHNAST